MTSSGFRFIYSDTKHLGFTFVCIRKNASTSIAKALYSAKNQMAYDAPFFPTNLNATDIYIYENGQSIPNLSDTFNFICLRNPFDRVVSLFVHKIIDHPNPDETSVGAYFIHNPEHSRFANNITAYFDDFLTFLEQTDLRTCNEHMAYQYSCGAFDLVKYNQILDFRNIDWKSIQQKFGIIPDLPEQKIHETKSEIYISELKPIFEDRVKEIYKLDYEYLGFTD